MSVEMFVHPLDGPTGGGVTGGGRAGRGSLVDTGCDLGRNSRQVVGSEAVCCCTAGHCTAPGAGTVQYSKAGVSVPLEIATCSGGGSPGR